jgi:hypothetical protein
LQLSRLSAQPGYVTAIHKLAEQAQQRLRTAHLIQAVTVLDFPRAHG